MPSGLFRPSNSSLLSGANKVYVPYCTSDAHMGDKEAFGRQFRGGRVVQAVVKDLVQRRGLGHGLHGKDLIIFGGQSAGGRGAMVHLDYIKEMVGPAAAPNVEVVGFLDSPLWIDIPPYGPSGFVGFAKTCQGVFENFGVNHLGSECVVAHPGVDDAWKCIMGEYRMPHVQTPYLIVASQYDAFQLGTNKINPLSARLHPDASKYANDFAHRTAAAMQSLRKNWKNTGAQNAVFSWACFDHASSLSARGFDKQTCGKNGPTLDVAMRKWLALAGLYHLLALAGLYDLQESFEWIDLCDGFACGSGCRLMESLTTHTHNQSRLTNHTVADLPQTSTTNVVV